VLLAALLAAAGCTNGGAGPVASANVVAALSAQADAAFARAYEPRPFTFPADHGAHPEYQTEWWYFTGNLTGAAGQEYGYQFTIFRSALTPDLPPRESALATNQVYMGHFAVTDVSGSEHYGFERYSRGAGGLAGAQGEPSFAVWLDDWSVTQDAPDTMRVQAAAVTEDGTPVALDLSLTSTRPPLLHGDAGLSQKGPEPGNANYYYSLVGLDTQGTLSLGAETGAETVDVTGLSWMDHEFGTSALSANAVGWDWFSLQLDNGMALMLAQIRTTDGGVVSGFKGTLAHPDGTQQVISEDDYVLETRGEWTSPVTGITYPSGWQVVFPALDLDLTITPLIPDQEMQLSFVYWEGAVMVEGLAAGAPVTGRGYVELTGYGSPQSSQYQR
jgi:predicted secreted hydrolase